jgi:hypothetical protein
MKTEELNQLLYEALETEMGGVLVYKTAIRCAINEELKSEWEEYLEQTEKHVEVVRELCQKFGLDPKSETPGRQVVRHIGQSLVKAMELALKSGKPEAAQIVAAECVVETETKDHLNWELIFEVAKQMTGEERKVSRKPTKRLKKKKTSTSTIPRAGAGSCGWNLSVYLLSFPLRKKKRTLRRQSVLSGPNKAAGRCSSYQGAQSMTWAP